MPRALLVSTVVLVALVGGCADCRKKDEAVVPEPPPQQQQAPLEHKPSVQYKKVMDLKPQGVPQTVTGPQAVGDAGTDAP